MDYSYTHINYCNSLPDGYMRLCSPCMRVIQVRQDSPIRILFSSRRQGVLDPHMFLDRALIPAELQAELAFRYGSTGECIDLLSQNPSALQKVLDIEHEKNDPTSAKLIEPFVALAKIVRARSDMSAVIQEIRNGV